MNKEKLFLKLIKSTSDKALRWFLYKFLQIVLTIYKLVINYFNVQTNRQKNYMLCDRYLESIEHLFRNFQIIEKFWKVTQN